MKPKKHLIILSGIAITVLSLFLFSFKPQSPSPDNDIAIMRVYESANINMSKILISYKDDQHTEIELWSFKNKFVEEWFDNADTITSRISWFKKQGYEIISTSSGGSLNSINDFLLTTYILEHK
jgi:hypothetical protein